MEPPDPRDTYQQAFGGLSIILESDEAMAALSEIPMEPDSDKTMADIVIATAQSMADFRASVEEFLKGDT